MTAGTLLAFTLLELTLCLIPGPAVLLVLSTALRRGQRTGMAAALGILTGNTLYFLLSALGVVAILLASYVAFTFVKYAGAAYLAYLGVRALFARRAPPLEPSATPAAGASRGAFGAGFVTQVSNPKAIVFFAAILPQFVDPRNALPLQFVVLALVSQLVELIVLSGYAAAAGRLRRSPAAARASLWIERAGGAVLLGIAARIAREPLAGLR